MSSDNSSKLSKKDLQEIFDGIIKWARSQGCKVYVHKNKKTVNGSNGYFTPDPEPHIRMGIKGRPLIDCNVLLLHELCHFWQWKDKFMHRIDDEGNAIYGRILDGKDVTPEERDRARKLVALSEYDCEQRTAFLLAKWNLTGVRSVQRHIKAANSYNRHISWSVGTSTKPGSGEFFPGHETVADKLWPNQTKHHWFTKEEIVAPISDEHKKVFDEAMAAHKKKKKS